MSGQGSAVAEAEQLAPEPAVELFDPPPTQRSWSAGDALRLLIGLLLVLVGLLLATAAQETLEGFETDVVNAFTELPDGVEQAVIGIAQVIALFIPVVTFILLLFRRQWRLLVLLVVVPNLAGVVLAVVQNAIGDRAANVLAATDSIADGWLADASFPTAEYVAASVAFVTIAAPWLSRRWKRAAWAAVEIVVILRVVSISGASIDLVLAVGVGMVLGSLALLVFGSPNAEPRPQELLAAVRHAGFDPIAIRRPQRQGETPVFCMTDRDGQRFFLKLRTPDDQRSDLLNRIYAAVRLKSSEVSLPYNTLKRRVEHEALLLRLANDACARVPELLAVGTTDTGSAFVVQTMVDGPSMAELEPEALTDALIRDMWQQVRCLHHARLAHRNLGFENLLTDASGSVWVVDFDDAELAPRVRDSARDVTELLVEVSMAVGPERAVATAIEVLGTRDVAATLPLLQPLALTGDTRQRLRGHKSVLGELRTEVARQTGAEEIELDQLVRVRPRTLIMIVALAAAFYALLPQLGNIDDTAQAFIDAELGWIPGILAASFITYIWATVSYLGSVTTPVPVLGAFRVQIASAFTGLVGPASAGGLAMSVRFLQRTGLSASEASAATAVNAIAGAVAHGILLFTFFAWAGSGGVGQFSLPDANTVLLIIGIAIALLGALLLIGPVRRRVVPRAVSALRGAFGHVANVMMSPWRVVALLGGSAALTLTYIAGLVFSVEAFGGGLSLAQIGSVYLAAGAVATVSPTPGGLGPMEAFMVAGFTGFGMADGNAVSAVLTFRLATYWLPIPFGWATFNWMQRHDEL